MAGNRSKERRVMAATALIPILTSLAPDLPGDFEQGVEFSPFVVDRDRIADINARESTLGTDRQVFDGDKLRGFFNAPLELVF